MPIVKTKKAMNGLEAGQVLEVQATDKGSKADIKGMGRKYRSSIFRYIRRRRSIKALSKKIL